MSEHDELMGILRKIHMELRRGNDAYINGITSPIEPADDIDVAIATSIAAGIADANPVKPAPATTAPPPADIEQPSFYDVSGPGPQLNDVHTVLVASSSIVTAQDVAARWRDGTSQMTTMMTISNKPSRDEWTKRIRSDPQVFDQISRENNSVLFVVGDMDMQPTSWRPAFDVIAVVSSSMHGLVYQLIKGRRARV